MITTLLLIRHGQTDWNIAGRWQGHTDIPLNDVGIVQSRLLAERLKSWPISAIYSSDLQRAAKTAGIIADGLELRPVLTATLRERHGGVFQGMTAAEMQDRFPDALQLIQEDGGAPPEGESNFEVAQRLWQMFDSIIENHRGEMVAVVSHGGALAIIIAYALGFPLGQRARISIRGNTGLSTIEFDDHGPRVTLLNDVNHLIADDHDEGAGFSFHKPSSRGVEPE
jgi:broad specificity phosphatase PhoE